MHKYFEGSEVWDSEIKEVAMARLQQLIERLEQWEQELLPVETRIRQMGSTMQSLRDMHREREGEIKKRRSRDNALQ